MKIVVLQNDIKNVNATEPSPPQSLPNDTYKYLHINFAYLQVLMQTMKMEPMHYRNICRGVDY
jgi:hypothetical protein